MKFWVVMLCWLCCSLNSMGQSKKMPACNKNQNFCWYGPYADNSDEASASGNRWVSPDKKEPPLEFVTAIRCLKSLKLCINARNLELLGKRTTVVDLFYVSKWSSVQIEATREDRPEDLGCTSDTLLLNKVEQTATLISTPGPAGRDCAALLRPKTISYTLVE
jgi:hypothetical protein